ncbi:MAG: phosphoribosylformylglycinamidine cyclo-ligase, partial [Chlorobia bacterium]|nr:phosphoribosylformylglycinamidine cyclo-ligase [Fimbriimonadaceae bacterium]
ADPLTYKDAGVNIDEAQRALRSVVGGIQSTYTENVISGVGGFGSLFRASFEGISNPILVSSIDGVGTKTKVAAMVGQHKNLGHDIVNHCANDILCQGAKPLFFMDYFGCSRLEGLVFEEILQGLIEACTNVGASLVGGETAEMPGVYHDGEVDLVGSIVGIVDYEKRLPKGKMSAGDAIVGIMSDGLHTNGYSLARRALFEYGGMSVRDPVPGTENSIGEELLRPHRCYFNSVYPLIQESDAIYAVAHVTGGGLYDNLPRVMPADARAVIERRSWTTLPIFSMIQEAGNVADHEMYRAFNMGIGMVLFCDRFAAPGIVDKLKESGEQAMIIGEVQSGSHDVQIV